MAAGRAHRTYGTHWARGRAHLCAVVIKSTRSKPGVLCTLTVAVRLLAARAIGIRHKASATALRVPAAPRACSKRSTACNTLAKG
eukprot:COSAG06_NODE_48770_length_329_cov_4.021739_1_plen_84_part_10